MAAVSALCSRAVFLKNGRLAAEGPTQDVVSVYQAEGVVTSQALPLSKVPRSGTGKAQFRRLSIDAFDKSGQPTQVITAGSDVRMELRIECLKDLAPTNVAIIINDPYGYRLIDVNTASNGDFLELRLARRRRWNS